jgi:hypothetical protein
VCVCVHRRACVRGDTWGSRVARRAQAQACLGACVCVRARGRRLGVARVAQAEDGTADRCERVQRQPLRTHRRRALRPPHPALTLARTLSRTQARTQACRHAGMHAASHAHTHARTHEHAHTRTRARKRTRTRTFRSRKRQNFVMFSGGSPWPVTESTNTAMLPRVCVGVRTRACHRTSHHISYISHGRMCVCVCVRGLCLTDGSCVTSKSSHASTLAGNARLVACARVRRCAVRCFAGVPYVACHVYCLIKLIATCTLCVACTCMLHAHACFRYATVGRHPQARQI